MACSPNTPVKWSDVYAVAQRIDALAETLNTPSYEKLADVTDMPFKFSDLVNFSGAIRFAVNSGTITVSDQHLSDGVQLTAPHNLDSVLEEMGKNEDLFLVVEEDDCWCKTIFEIDTNSGDPRVKEVDDLGCCQSLFVPQPGDDLDYGQHIIPAGAAKQYAASGNPEEGAVWQVRPACVAETVQSGFKFQSSELEAPLTDCTREIQTAKFTWPMRAAYMDKMIEKLKYILECDNSGGAKADEIRTPDPDEEYIPIACEVSICDLVKDRVERGLMDYSTAGCVSQGCNAGGSEPTAYPWNSATCGGENCDSNGPKFYCRTLEDLEAILDIAETGLRPRNAPDEVCGPCTCSWTAECEDAVGTGESCWVYVGSGGEALIGFIDEVHFEEPACVNTYAYAYTEGIRESCSSDTGPAGPDPCTTELVNASETCDEGMIIGNFTIPVFGGSNPSWSDLKAAAYSQHSGCELGPGGCTAYASTFYAIPVDPPVAGLPAAWAEKASMRVRFRMAGSWSCSGSQSPTRTVKYRKTVINEGEVTETEHNKTASWDSSEQTYVTDWIDEEAPAWPGDNPGSNSVSYEVIRGDRQCPEGCTPSTP